jgi:superfamily II DNA or RNA helicase
VQHYLAERDKYGPTLIFALNVRHAALLADALRERDVRAEYVASCRPNGSEGDSVTPIQRFREGQLDVLINVQMVTEGVDAPGIPTVFLTSPTTSEILLQ